MTPRNVEEGIFGFFGFVGAGLVGTAIVVPSIPVGGRIVLGVSGAVCLAISSLD